MRPKSRMRNFVGWIRNLRAGNEAIPYRASLWAALCAGRFALRLVRRFDVIQQTRLPPSHSHHWLTDGLFPVIEGWLTGKGYAGCATLAELVAYLKMRFSRADNYKSKHIEINVLLVTFAYTKWYGGKLWYCILTNTPSHSYLCTGLGLRSCESIMGVNMSGVGLL